MLKLYYVPKTRAIRPRWLLEELGVPYELVRLDPSKGETRTDTYLKLNPLGHVPALEDDGTVIAESTAIVLHLADRFPEKSLAPAPGSPDRARYYQWMIHAMVTLEPQLGVISEQARLPPEERNEKVAEKAKVRFRQEVAALEAHLKGRSFVVGDRFTAADVVVGAVLSFARMNGVLEELPACAAYAQAMLGRPAAKKARED